ncbi:DUF1351 domain-containing protein [Streptococcus suis]|nr:DUF1351 domain-containing protein [Streptococcus suis]
MTDELSLFDNLETMAPIPATELDFDFEFTPAQITIVGKELLEKALASYVEKYKNYTVTAETFEDDAKVRAELNNLEKKIKSAVKEKLADYNKPIDEVKDWIGILLKPIAEIRKSIDEGVKEFEERERQKRVATIKDLFIEAIKQSGKEIDIRLFGQHFDEFSKKGFFMADNIRPKKATVDRIVELVALEVAKEEERENALIQITEAAAKADLGPASYVLSFKQGAKLADVLQAIADDKALADRHREEDRQRKELAKRIEEMTAIAESKGLNPDKYAQLLQNGTSPLMVHEELVNDARKLEELQRQKQEQAEKEAASIQKNSQNEQKELSEGNYTHEQQTATQEKTEPNKKVIKWQGEFRVTFPDGETAKLFGGKGGLYEQHRVVVEKLGEWVKIND